MNINVAVGARSEAAPVSENQEQGNKGTAMPSAATTPVDLKPSAQRQDENRPKADFNHPQPAPSSVESSSSPETSESNNASNSIRKGANATNKPAESETPTNSCSDATPPAKEKQRTERDDEDVFRVIMGMLPHSRNTQTVTDDMREILRQGFDELDGVRRMNFAQCLHSSIPDAKRYLHWEGFGQAVIDFEKLPKIAVHDLTLFLKLHGVVEDHDGEAKRVLSLLKEKQAGEGRFTGIPI